MVNSWNMFILFLRNTKSGCMSCYTYIPVCMYSSSVTERRILCISWWPIVEEVETRYLCLTLLTSGAYLAPTGNVRASVWFRGFVLNGNNSTLGTRVAPLFVQGSVPKTYLQQFHVKRRTFFFCFPLSPLQPRLCSLVA